MIKHEYRDEREGNRASVITERNGASVEYVLTEAGIAMRTGFGAPLELVGAPASMTLDRLAENLQKNGYTVRRSSATENRRREREYNEYQRTRPDYELGQGMEDNSAHRRAARRQRINDAAMKRARRRK